jgi:Asp-tRNA(Asn)/Glu-tRNA(Gln) amidotransferase A subunit family amidase
LPLGIQMVGAFNADTALLECGHWLEGVIRSNEPSSAVSMSDAA